MRGGNPFSRWIITGASSKERRNIIYGLGLIYRFELHFKEMELVDMTIKRNYSDGVPFEVLFKAYLESKMEELIKENRDECYNKDIADTPCESEVAVWQ